MNAAAMLESIKSRFQADLYDSPEEAESAWQEMLAEEIEEIEAEAENDGHMWIAYKGAEAERLILAA